jgi:hypothetical protein
MRPSVELAEMDSGWIGVGGVALGVAGTIVVQHLNNRRTDVGVRRELRARLGMVVKYLDPGQESVLLPQLRRYFTAAIERASRGDVGTALNIDQLYAVFDAVDRLQLLMILIDSLPQPEDGCFEIDKETAQGKSILEFLAIASASVKAAGFVLRKRKFLLKPNTYANRYTKLKG